MEAGREGAWQAGTGERAASVASPGSGHSCSTSSFCAPSEHDAERPQGQGEGDTPRVLLSPLPSLSLPCGEAGVWAADLTHHQAEANVEGPQGQPRRSVPGDP